MQTFSIRLSFVLSGNFVIELANFIVAVFDIIDQTLSQIVGRHFLLQEILHECSTWYAAAIIQAFAAETFALRATEWIGCKVRVPNGRSNRSRH